MKRVKCDENKAGGCKRCQNNGAECDYLRSQPVMRNRLIPFQLTSRTNGDVDDGGSRSPTLSQSPGSPARVTSGEDEFSLPLLTSPSAQSVLIKSTVELTPSMPSDTTSQLALFHHFEVFTSHTCGSPLGQSIIRSCVFAAAGRFPFLMHAMLGATAAHMSYLIPADVNAVQHRRNRLAETWHWGRALALFRKELGGPGRSNMDALLSTIIMVAIHQFALREDDDRSLTVTEADCWKTSFVFIEDGDERLTAMKWLTIQSGFKLLLNQLGRYLSESAWLPVFEDANPAPDSKITPGIEAEDEVERLLCEHCKITPESTAENNIYYTPIETVIFVRRSRPVTVELFNKLITFMGRLSPEVQDLIWRRDTGALMILCHWLSLMAELKEWWINARAERECRAIILYLSAKEMKGRDADLVRTVLEEPARAIGLVL